VDGALPATVREVRAALERGSLFFAVFVSGAVLLGVEIASSRVLAPFFGNSLYVWGALIGVVLTGLAIGYWVGGVLADRRPSIGLLLAVMALGALLVLAVPFVDDRVLRWVVDWDPGARLNPLVAATVLFGLPSVVLAAVTPVAVRIAARDVLTLGRTAGRLFAVSTVGSIVGTFATAFVLIPEFGTNQLLAQGAAVLLAGTALVASARALPIAGVAALAAAAAAAALSVSLAPEQGGTLSAAAAENYSPVYRLREGAVAGSSDYEAEGFDVRFRKDSAYHSIAVVEDSTARYLRFDSSFQSAMELDRPFVSPFEYVDYLSLALAYRPTARNVLFVGLGGGSAPKRLWRDFPSVRIQAVELDPEVVDVAYRWFELPRSPRLQVEVEDGRRFLVVDERRWDVIVLDAYYADSIPFHLATREFMQLVRERLAPGGVVVANVIGALEGENSKLFRSFYRTYRSVFPSLTVHPVDFQRDAVSVRNIIVVAAQQALPSRDFLLERWNGLREEHPQAPDLTGAINRRYEKLVPTRDVPILTDDYAPTDALLLVD
jgi:spermidine synthase